MAWEEWEQLKATAVERKSAHTQLNQLSADQGEGTGTSGTYGPPSGKLRSDRAAWSRAGEGVGDLRDNVRKALTTLEGCRTALGKEAGCLTSAARQGVHDSWKRRLEDISTLCDGLAGVLEKTGNDHLRTDEAVKAEIARLRAGAESPSTADGKGR